jgi:DivIVA domain-containing protein
VAADKLAAMALDRRSVEKRDFPLRLRGYDRVAVDAHLRAIADALEARASTADAAAEQVRAVLAAAEQSAAEIVARAEGEAARIEQVNRAGDEAAGRVTAAASGALERIEALRGELTTLLDALGMPLAAPVGAPAPAPAGVPADDTGARLVALDLALSGAPREQAAAVLAEQFALGTRAPQLLDDVYAAAGR